MYRLVSHSWLCENKNWSILVTTIHTLIQNQFPLVVTPLFASLQVLLSAQSQLIHFTRYLISYWMQPAVRRGMLPPFPSNPNESKIPDDVTIHPHFYTYCLLCFFVVEAKKKLKHVIHRLCTVTQLIWAIQSPVQCDASSRQTKQSLQVCVSPFHSGYQYQWWMTDLPAERKLLDWTYCGVRSRINSVALIAICSQ